MLLLLLKKQTSNLTQPTLGVLLLFILLLHGLEVARCLEVQTTPRTLAIFSLLTKLGSREICSCSYIFIRRRVFVIITTFGYTPIDLGMI